MTAYVDWYAKERRQNWRTPIALFDKLDDRFSFDLDGASDAENALAEGSTVHLPIPWIGRRVFCNPPWSDIAPFIEIAPLAACAVLLVPSRVNAKWFHRALELGARVEFFLGRPRFQGGMSDSPVDCLLLVWGA